MTRSFGTPESNLGYYSHLPLVVLAALCVLPAAADEEEVTAASFAPTGLRVESGLSQSGSASVVSTDPSMAALLEGLQNFAVALAASQSDLDIEEKRVLYANLWDLYD